MYLRTQSLMQSSTVSSNLCCCDIGTCSIFSFEMCEMSPLLKSRLAFPKVSRDANRMHIIIQNILDIIGDLDRNRSEGEKKKDAAPPGSTFLVRAGADEL